MLFLSSNIAKADEKVYELNIPSQNAAAALEQLAEQTGAITLFPYDLAEAERVNAVIGRYTLQGALDLMFVDTGLTGDLSDKRVISITKSNRINYEEESMYKEKIFKKTGIAAALTALLSVGSTAVAQEAVAQQSTSQLEEVVVTGIRASLQQSLDVKRDASAVVDSVSSEDVGKFPDANIADSLQRITGVAIERNGGEGQFITVRGLGPEFNTVLVNGRVIATENDGREFSFDVLSSDIIRRADVYKTSNVAQQSGGIGSTVNIVTANPFDFNETKLSFSVGGIYDTLAEETSPEVSAVYSTINEDKTFGFLASLAYSDRESRHDGQEVNGYNPSGNFVNAPANSVGVGAGVIETGRAANVPQNFLFHQTTAERERLTATTSLQFQASDDLLLTVNGLYNDFDFADDRRDLAWFFGGGSTFIDPTFSSNNTLVGFNRFGQSFLDANPLIGAGNTQTDHVSVVNERFAESYQIGLNAKWDVSDSLRAEFDLSTSNASTDNSRDIVVVGAQNIAPPRFEINPGSLQVSNLTPQAFDPSFQRLHFAQVTSNEIEDDITEFRINLEKDFDGRNLQSVQFGAYISDREKTNVVGRNADTNCLFCGYNVPVDTSTISLTTFDGVNGSPFSTFVFDPRSILDQLENEGNIRAQLAAGGLSGAALESRLAQVQSLQGGAYFPREQVTENLAVEEEITSFFLNSSWAGELGSVPWSANLGVRVARTETTAKGVQAPVESITVPAGDDNLLIVLGAQTGVSFNNSYTNVLPSLNIKFDLADDKVLRLAASQTVTRPTLSSLGTNNTLQGRVGNALSSGGNPELEPFESLNFDVSYEWYYSDVSFFGVAGFYKDFDEFLETSTLPVTRTLDNGTPIVFSDTRTRNGETGSITGFEVGFQHTFDNLPGAWSGLGVLANYTYVDSDIDRAPGSSATNCDYNGLSPNSYNVAAFYEKGRIQARLAYNWREEFLIACQGFISQPDNRKDYGQTDFSLSYEVNDSFSVYFEGINIFDEVQEEFSITEDRFLSFDDFGSRYSFGVRGNF